VKIIEHTPFSVIQLNLDDLLLQSLTILDSWTVPVMTAEDPAASLQGWQEPLA
jgi:hypothetical protein